MMLNRPKDARSVLKGLFPEATRRSDLRFQALVQAYLASNDLTAWRVDDAAPEAIMARDRSRRIGLKRGELAATLILGGVAEGHGRLGDAENAYRNVIYESAGLRILETLLTGLVRPRAPSIRRGDLSSMESAKTSLEFYRNLLDSCHCFSVPGSASRSVVSKVPRPCRST